MIRKIEVVFSTPKNPPFPLAQSIKCTKKIAYSYRLEFRWIYLEIYWLQARSRLNLLQSLTPLCPDPLVSSSYNLPYIYVPYSYSLLSLWKIRKRTWQHSCENLQNVRGSAPICAVRVAQFVFPAHSKTLSTTLYQLMLQSWYQMTSQSLVNTLVLFSWHYSLP